MGKTVSLGIVLLAALVGGTLAIAGAAPAPAGPRVAIEHFRRALEIDPSFADAQNNWGSILVQQGRFTEAIEHFRRALAIDPGFTEAQRNLDRVLRAQGSSSSSR